MLMRTEDSIRRFGDPFCTTDPDSYFNWLNSGASFGSDPSRRITRLWSEVYRLRPDVQRVFPDLDGAHRDSFLQWARQGGKYEHGIADALIVQRGEGMAPMHPSARASGKNATERPFGVNVSGHANSEKGVGEVARSIVRALATTGIPYVVNDYRDPGSVNLDATLTDFAHENPYAANIIAMNADQLSYFAVQQGRQYFEDHYNIGHWAWELSAFPSEWFPSFEYLDEVWVASSFINDALKRVSPLPVVTVPYAITGEYPQPITHRLHFGLPQDTFVFLFIFDFASYIARKNPLGLIEAFKRAFRLKDNVLLLIKCSHSEYVPDDLRAIQQAAKGINVRITDSVLSREQVRTLIHLADCYISLHRAEGFGLTIAEAMSLEKPVIATGYSGNMDYMTEANSFPCEYRTVPIDRGHGPYAPGFVWAEPDLDHAAALMRHVYEHFGEAKGIGARARRDILNHCHPQVVGKGIRERLLQAVQ